MSSSDSRFWRLTRLALIGYWILVFTATHIPASKLPKTHVNDKIEHFAAYGTLCLLLYLNLWRRPWPSVAIGIVVLLIAMAYGAFDELTQPYFNRSCDIHDWYADTIGSAIVLVVLVAVRSFTNRSTKLRP